jgi:integrase
MGVKVRERKPGEWWLYICHRGARKAVKVGTKKAAKDKQIELEKALATGKLKLNPKGEPGLAPFKEVAGRWLRDHVELNLKPTSRERSRTMVEKRFVPFFGEQAIGDITRDHVRRFATKLRKEEGLSARTAKLHLVCLGGIFNFAIENGTVASNPAAKPGKIVSVPKGDRPDFLDVKETQIFLAAAKEHRPRLFPLFLTAARAGLRCGELRALRWDDVDWQRGTITVQWNVSEKTITTPKSGKSRVVDMTPHLAETLTAHRKALASESLKEGRSMPEYVFPNTKGMLMDKLPITSAFRSCLKAAKLRTVKLHSLRHSFASALLAAGASLAYVRDQLGHSDVKVTDIYVHASPEDERKALARLDDPLWNTGKNATPAQPETVGRIGGADNHSLSQVISIH